MRCLLRAAFAWGARLEAARQMSFSLEWLVQTTKGDYLRWMWKLNRKWNVKCNDEGDNIDEPKDSRSSASYHDVTTTKSRQLAVRDSGKARKRLTVRRFNLCVRAHHRYHTHIFRTTNEPTTTEVSRHWTTIWLSVSRHGCSGYTIRLFPRSSTRVASVLVSSASSATFQSFL